ncbi:MAG: pentapeptide repeat-containing protein [Elainellaceae cyanobacterium]
MGYCLNPMCPYPVNPDTNQRCQACGSKMKLNNRYRIVRQLGHGGFGATFLALDESLPGHPNCVIKQLRPVASSSEVLHMARELFQREAKTLGKIGDHPQVPRLLDYFDTNQEFYLVQEYISGYTLQQEVKHSGPLTEAGVKQFLSEILPMVQYIHSNQVIHRDIKPANLIRREQDKQLVLIDFGAVKDKVNPALASMSSENTALTSFAVGTPGYAPPEQMAMRPTYASDIYALGITCVYLLSGKSPRDMSYNPTTGEVLWKEHVHVSEHFANVIKRMLEISVGHRYQSAVEVLRALDLVPYMDSLAEGITTANRPDTRPKLTLSTELDHSTGTLSSPTARLAAQIRARNARRAADNSQFQTNGQTSVPLSGRIDIPTPPRRRAPQTSARQLLDAYSRGQRNFNARNLSLLNLQRAELADASFHDADFHQSKLMGANFQKCDLGGANFGRAGLQRAVLRDANLVGAFFTNADLANADLRGANLSYAHLLNANLQGVNLCGADLTGAKVSDDQLARARTNWKTVHPRRKRGLW